MMFGKGAETRFWPSKIKQQQKKAKKKHKKNSKRRGKSSEETWKYMK